MDAPVAFAAAVVVTKLCVKVEFVARSISKPASLAELSSQVRLIWVEPLADAASPDGPTPPRLIPLPNVATHTSWGLYGLMKTRSTHAKGKLVRSWKLE